MTLLTISQEILEETKNATIPQAIINNSEVSAVQILAALKKAIIDVARADDWQELQKEHTFSSVASTQGYALPSDFDRITDRTFWNTTRLRRVEGPQTPEDWRVLTNSTISGATVNDLFRIRGGETLLFPIPASVEAYIYEYITDLIVDSSGGTGQTGWEADSDVPNVDAYLVKLNATWRFLSMQGKPYAEEQRDYELNLAERISRNGGNKTVCHVDITSLNRSRIGYPVLVPSP
jgi:hypothetical protein